MNEETIMNEKLLEDETFEVSENSNSKLGLGVLIGGLVTAGVIAGVNKIKKVRAKKTEEYIDDLEEFDPEDEDFEEVVEENSNKKK